MDRRIFLSYKRDDHTTPVAERLRNRLQVQLGLKPQQVFFDRDSIEAGRPWKAAIDDFMGSATDFVALISVDYWCSEQCRREFDLALQRYERYEHYESAADRLPRLLFVLADTLDPNDLAIDADAAAARIDQDDWAKDRVARLRKVGDLNFLGPYSPAGKLVRLAFEDRFKLDDQLARMVETVKKLGQGG